MTDAAAQPKTKSCLSSDTVAACIHSRIVARGAYVTAFWGPSSFGGVQADAASGQSMNAPHCHNHQAPSHLTSLPGLRVCSYGDWLSTISRIASSWFISRLLLARGTMQQGTSWPSHTAGIEVSILAHSRHVLQIQVQQCAETASYCVDLLACCCCGLSMSHSVGQTQNCLSYLQCNSTSYRHSLTRY